MSQELYDDMPLQLRRKVAELLAQRGMSQNQMRESTQLPGTEYTPQGIAVKRSPLEYLARAATAGVHGYNAQQYSQQADQELANTDAARTAEMSGVQGALMGRAARELPGPQPQGVEGPLMDPGSKGSIVEAILKARGGQFPSTRAFGADLQKRMMDLRAEATKGLLKDATPNSTQQYMTSGDPAQLQPKPNYMQSGSAILTADPNKPALQTLTPDRFSQTTQNIGGVQVPAQTDTYTGETKPAATASITANPVGKSRERGSEFDLKLIQEGRDLAQKSAQGLGIVQEIAKGLQEAYTNGSLADVRTQVGKFATLIGGVPDPKNINAEYIDALLAKLGIADAKGLGPNPTDRDLKIIQQSIGTINTDPQALPKLLQVVYRIHAQRLGEYNGLVGRAEQAEKRLDPSADYQRWLVQSGEKSPDNPYVLLQNVLDKNLRGQGEAPAPKQPRRRIEVFGN